MNLQKWINKTIVIDDVIREQQARFMEATLNKDPHLKDGDFLPPLWHWLYFLEAMPEYMLGRDAHPKKGRFLPPIKLPRRMWAGGRFTFNGNLIIGQKAKKISTIKNIVTKTGSSGLLCFVTIEHKIFGGDSIALTEEQDLVYLADQEKGKNQRFTPSTTRHAEFSKKISPSEILLFRYSALTFNGHRIHYDADYARDVEGYDGLVFHGPLTATLLLELIIKQDPRPVKQFSFKGIAPLSNLDEFWLEGKYRNENAVVWARRSDGVIAMEAVAKF